MIFLLCVPVHKFLLLKRTLFLWSQGSHIEPQSGLCVLSLSELGCQCMNFEDKSQPIAYG